MTFLAKFTPNKHKQCQMKLHLNLKFRGPQRLDQFDCILNADFQSFDPPFKEGAVHNSERFPVRKVTVPKMSPYRKVLFQKG